MPSARQVIAVALRMVAHAIMVLMFAAGLAALVAAIASTAFAGDSSPEIASVIRGFGLRVSLTFLPGAIAAFALMPRRWQLLQRSAAPERDLPAALVFLTVVLFALAMLQVPAVLAWWAENRRLLAGVTGTDPDPLGLYLIPAAVLLSLPFLSTLSIVLMSVTSALVIVVQAERVQRTLAACVALLSGLVFGAYLALDSMLDAAQRALALVPHDVDPSFVATATDWIARQHDFGGNVLQHLVWTVGGYLLMLMLAVSQMPRRAESAEEGQTGPEVAGEPSKAETQPLVQLPASFSGGTLPVVTVQQSTGVFSRSNYTVRLRGAWTLRALLLSTAEYEIESIPKERGQRYTFSFSTGILRHEEDGVDLLCVRPAARAGWLTRRSYSVIAAAVGTPLGTLTPDGPDWDLLDPTGHAIARAAREVARYGYLRYAVRTAGEEVCRFTWSFHGLTLPSAELEVEFTPACDSRFDRALAMALALVLERQIRARAVRASP